jgi:hypothetical protein
VSNLVFPSSLPGFGIKVGRTPDFKVTVDKTESRKELRSTWETYPQTIFKVDFEILRDYAAASPSRNELQQALGFLARSFGSLDSFLLTDPTDSSVADMGFAVGDGVTSGWQLQRTLGGAIIDAYANQYNPQTKPYLNLLKNSSFEFSSGGLATGWGVYTNSGATEATFASIVPGMNGGSAQRISWGTNNTTSKGINGPLPAWVAGQWYTVSFFARASGTNIGQTMDLAWNQAPNTIIRLVNPPLTASWQRYVFQFKWNPGFAVEQYALYFTILYGTGTFGDLDFDEAQLVAGQHGVNDFQPMPGGTPANATGTRTPSYWPAWQDGFEPIYDLSSAPTIYQDGDWVGRRTIYAYARTNLLPYASAFDNGAWTKGAAFAQAGAGTAPDGTITAEAITEGQPAAPTLATATPSAAGGTLAAGTYFIKLTATNSVGESLGSNELSATTTGTTGSIALTWNALPWGSTGVKVYVGTAAGAEGQYFVQAGGTSFTITTATGTAGTIPAAPAAAYHYLIENTSPAEVQGELRCYSVFVRAGTLPNICIYVGTSSDAVCFNLGTGAVDPLGASGLSAPLASGVQTSPLWPGWYRAWFVKRVTATLGTGLSIAGAADATYARNYVSTGRYFFAWGAMAERVSNLNGPTTYIATPGGAAVSVTDYTLSASGFFTPAGIPAAGVFFSWDGTYYRRVRFDKNPTVERISSRMWGMKSIDLILVKP